MDFFLVVCLVGRVVFFETIWDVVLVLSVVIGLINEAEVVVDLTVVVGFTGEGVDVEVGSVVVVLFSVETGDFDVDDSSKPVDEDWGFRDDGWNGKYPIGNLPLKFVAKI